ncbi:MAG: glycosyltransferase family 4 protein [Syntrophaceae bacterium]
MKARAEKKAVYMVAYTTYATDPRVRREAETLASLADYEVTIVVPKTGTLPRATDFNGVNVVELNAGRYWGKSFSAYLLSYLKFLVAVFFDCTRRTLGGRVDIVHIHNMPNFLIFSAMVPRLMGKKVILDIHDTVPETYIDKFKDYGSLISRILCLEEALCCRMAHRILCVNHPQREMLIGRGIPGQKISVSLNVPDDRWFSNGGGAVPKRGAADSFDLVYHGTLARRLGVDLTIRAVADLKEKIPGLKFHVIGAGDDEGELIAMAERLGLESCVIFHGLIPIERLASALRPMHLGVISNRRNRATELMLPVKMLEYISLGIPVVAPPLKTIRHYFSDDMLTFFDAEDVASLSAAILEAYSSEEKRLTQARRARAFLERFGWQRHKQDLLDLYRSLSRPS